MAALPAQGFHQVRRMLACIPCILPVPHSLVVGFWSSRCLSGCSLCSSRQRAYRHPQVSLDRHTSAPVPDRHTHTRKYTHTHTHAHTHTHTHTHVVRDKQAHTHTHRHTLGSQQGRLRIGFQPPPAHKKKGTIPFPFPFAFNRGRAHSTSVDPLPRLAPNRSHEGPLPTTTALSSPAHPASDRGGLQGPGCH